MGRVQASAIRILNTYTKFWGSHLTMTASKQFLFFIQLRMNIYFIQNRILRRPGKR